MYHEGSSNRAVRAFFFDHISSLFTALSWYQTNISLIEAIEAGVLSELSFTWLYITPGTSVKTLRGRGMFVFSWFAIFHFSQKVVQCAVCVSFFNLLPLSFSCANLHLAVKRIANLQLFNFDSSFNDFNVQPL